MQRLSTAPCRRCLAQQKRMMALKTASSVLCMIPLCAGTDLSRSCTRCHRHIWHCYVDSAQYIGSGCFCWCCTQPAFSTPRALPNVCTAAGMVAERASSAALGLPGTFRLHAGAVGAGGGASPTALAAAEGALGACQLPPMKVAERTALSEALARALQKSYCAVQPAAELQTKVRCSVVPGVPAQHRRALHSTTFLSRRGLKGGPSLGSQPWSAKCCKPVQSLRRVSTLLASSGVSSSSVKQQA